MFSLYDSLLFLQILNDHRAKLPDIELLLICFRMGEPASGMLFTVTSHQINSLQSAYLTASTYPRNMLLWRLPTVWKPQYMYGVEELILESHLIRTVPLQSPHGKWSRT